MVAGQRQRSQTLANTASSPDPLQYLGGSQPGTDFTQRVDAELAEIEEAMDWLGDEAPGDPAELQQAGVALPSPAASESAQEANAHDLDEADTQLAVLPPMSAMEDPFREAKKRRLFPGADKTCAAFDAIFKGATEACQASLAQMPQAAADQNCTVLQQTRAICHFVRSRYPMWQEDFVRVAAGALTVYRTRYTDLFVRDYVALIWIIEGQRYLRAHNGICYLYHSHGSFEAFAGVPPEATFVRVKRFLQQAEGLFRLMNTALPRNDQAVLDEIARLLADQNSERELLTLCEDTAILYGGAKPVSRSGGRQRQDDEDGNQPHPSAPWTLHIAYNISRLVTPLQRDLLDEKRLLYFVGHWCSTPSERQPGCAYADCCVVYDRHPQRVTLIQPSPDLNIYMRVPHPLYNRCLSDPVLDVAKQRLQKFFRQTFWCNEVFFQACQAALALAKRGENIDRRVHKEKYYG